MDTHTRFTPARRRALVVGIAVLAAAVAATFFVMSRGSGSASANAGPVGGFAGGPPGMQQQQQQGGTPPSSSAFQQFEQCMAKNGVTLTPGQRPDFDDASARKALDACRSYLPARPDNNDDGQAPQGFGPNGQPVAPQDGSTT